MSIPAKLTLATTVIGTAGVVAFVHWAQTAEKSAMHAGVVRDMENQERKRQLAAQNLHHSQSTAPLNQAQQDRRLDFEIQKKLEEEYLKTQKVHDSTTGG